MGLLIWIALQFFLNVRFGTGDGEQLGPKKKVVYARKKPSKKPSDTAAAEAAAEAEAEEARLAEVNASSQTHSAIT